MQNVTSRIVTTSRSAVIGPLACAPSFGPLGEPDDPSGWPRAASCSTSRRATGPPTRPPAISPNVAAAIAIAGAASMP
jgi:hypothetical protein